MKLSIVMIVCCQSSQMFARPLPNKQGGLMVLPSSFLWNMGCMFGCSGQDSDLILTKGGDGIEVSPLMAEFEPDGSLVFTGGQDEQHFPCSTRSCSGDAVIAIPKPNSDPIIVVFGEDNDNKTVTLVLGEDGNDGGDAGDVCIPCLLAGVEQSWIPGFGNDIKDEGDQNLEDILVINNDNNNEEVLDSNHDFNNKGAISDDDETKEEDTISGNDYNNDEEALIGEDAIKDEEGSGQIGNDSTSNEEALIGKDDTEDQGDKTEEDLLVLEYDYTTYNEDIPGNDGYNYKRKPKNY